MTLLASLVQVSQRVAATPARLAKVRELAALLAGLTPDEIGIAVHYLSGEIPQGRIGLGSSGIRAAMPGAGADAGTLTLVQVDECLTRLAGTRGGGSQAARAALLRDLLSRASAPEQQFLLGLLTGGLRQGALAGIMNDAIASAAGLPAADVRRAAMFSKDLGAIARAALLDGAASLQAFQLEMFSPVSPMLAQTAADVGEALAMLPGQVAFEWKMDGARIQVHKVDQDVRLYTRGLNEITAALPEVAESVREFSAHTLVLDGEAIAVDASGRPHPFQITMRRFGRKLHIEASRSELPIRAFFFDCLRVGSESLIGSPVSERHRALAGAVPATARIPRLVTSVESAAREFYEAAIAAGHEGLMAKSLDSAYEAGNRGAAWLKIKYVHTLDLIVLAAEWGHGRRTGKLSNLHLGAFDRQSGGYIMLGKTFKGLTDALLEWQTRELLAREIRRDAGTVFVRPELVVEIAFSDLQASSRYPGGLALRLARVKRYREDKSAQEADTMEAVRAAASRARARAPLMPTASPNPDGAM